MSFRFIAYSVGLSLSVAATGAVAQATAPTFESLDKNKDSQVSLDEASAHDDLFTAFKTLDKNKDGILTRDEFAAYQPGRSGA